MDSPRSIKRLPVLRVVSLALLLVGIATSSALAVDRRVPADHRTIHEAIDAAEDGDRILVAAGRYEISRPIRFLGKGVVLESESGPAETVLAMAEPTDPSDASVIVFDAAEPPQATLRGFTLTGGKGIGGSFQNVPARFGGGIFCGSIAAPLIEGNHIVENESALGAGAYCARESQPRFVNNVFARNRAQFNPGGCCKDTSIGGGLYVGHDSRVTVIDGSFDDNIAGDGGGIGGVELSQLRVEGVTMSRNVAHDDGGAIRFRGEWIELHDSTFVENRSGDRGGAVVLSMSGAVGPDQPPPIVTVRACRFERNHGNLTGGGLCIRVRRARARIEESEFVANSVSGVGGGLHVDYQTIADVIDTQFLHNRAGVRGGGAALEYEGELELHGCVFAGNGSLEGGGIGSQGAVTIVGSTIAGNAAYHGGGMFLTRSAPLFVVSSIVWDNGGASIYSELGGATVTHSCVSPGIFNGHPIASFGANNTAEPPLFAGWASDRVSVDADAPEGGDGTPERPFRRLEDALTGFDLRLTAESPCIGTGLDGANMGADLGIAEERGTDTRQITVAAGEYALASKTLAHGVSISGAGRRSTILVGSALGLRSGTTLEDVTITRGRSGGISIGSLDDPVISRCLVVHNRADIGGAGISGGVHSAGRVVDVTVEGNLMTGRRFVGFPTLESPSGGVFSAGSATTEFRRCRIIGNDILHSSEAGRVASDVATRDGAVFTNCLVVGSLHREWTVFAPGTSFVHSTAIGAIVDGNWTGSVIEGSTQSSSIEGSLVLPDIRFVRSGVFDATRRTVVEIAGEAIEMPDFIVEPGDYRLREDSRAIDAGTPDTAPAEDIDGVARPCGAGADLGAFESDCPQARFWRGDANSDGGRNVADAIATLNELFAQGEPARCADAADVNDDGRVNIADPIFLLNFLFAENDPPPAPTVGCGSDPTADELSCLPVPSCP